MIGEVFTLASKVLLSSRNIEYMSALRVGSIREAVCVFFFHGKQFHLRSLQKKLCMMKL